MEEAVVGGQTLVQLEKRRASPPERLASGRGEPIEMIEAMKLSQNTWLHAMD
jgi:hypothetical protein